LRGIRRDTRKILAIAVGHVGVKDSGGFKDAKPALAQRNL
jgi:hypothetical protein